MSNVFRYLTFKTTLYVRIVTAEGELKTLRNIVKTFGTSFCPTYMLSNFTNKDHEIVIRKVQRKGLMNYIKLCVRKKGA